jgi:hypothetical protein
MKKVLNSRKYQRGGRDRGNQHSTGLGAGPGRADAQGGSRPDGARGLEPRRSGGGVRRPAPCARACTETGGRPVAGAASQSRGGRGPAAGGLRWAGRADGGRRGGGLGGWRLVADRQWTGGGATAGWRSQLADCFSRAAAVSRVRSLSVGPLHIGPMTRAWVPGA